MATLAELRTSISARLLDVNNTSISSANIDEAINDSIRQYKKEHFYFNEELITRTLVEDNPEITNFPTDYLDCLEGGFAIIHSQQRWPLQKVLPSQYDLENVEGKGIPYMITERAGKWYVYFYPDNAYTLQIYYLKDYAELSSDGDSNDFTNEAEAMIRYNALSRLFAEFKQDEKMEAYFTARAKSEYDTLIAQTQSRLGTGYLEVEQM